MKINLRNQMFSLGKKKLIDDKLYFRTDRPCSPLPCPCSVRETPFPKAPISTFAIVSIIASDTRDRFFMWDQGDHAEPGRQSQQQGRHSLQVRRPGARGLRGAWL